LNQKKGSLIEESLEVLRDKTLAIDADILLKKVKANPKKSLQDGHCALDMSVQLGIMKIIEAFRLVYLLLGVFLSFIDCLLIFFLL
jgi:hypothetical protein